MTPGTGYFTGAVISRDREVMTKSCYLDTTLPSGNIHITFYICATIVF